MLSDDGASPENPPDGDRGVEALQPKPLPPNHQVRAGLQPRHHQSRHRQRHGPAAQNEARPARAHTHNPARSRSPSPNDDAESRRMPHYDAPPPLKLDGFTNVVNYSDSKELARVVKQQRLEMQSLLERDAEREARVKQLQTDAQRRLSKLRNMNKHLKSEAERAKEERLESLKSLESRSDR